MKRKLPLFLLVLFVLAAAAFFTVAPALAEWMLNRTHVRGPRRASERALALHRSLFVADMHADTLLWDRDVLARSSRGHVDVPRLAEGGVALQFFTVVTKAPFSSNYESNAEGFNGVTALAVAERWPVRTWRSLLSRALHQSRKLHDAAARSGGRLTILRTAGDLASFAERRRGDSARSPACSDLRARTRSKATRRTWTRSSTRASA